VSALNGAVKSPAAINVIPVDPVIVSAMRSVNGYSNRPQGTFSADQLLQWQASCHGIVIVEGATVKKSVPNLVGRERGVFTAVPHTVSDPGIPLWGTVWLGEAASSRVEAKGKVDDPNKTQLIELSARKPEEEYMVMEVDPAWCMAALINSSIGCAVHANLRLEVDDVVSGAYDAIQLRFVRSVPANTQLLWNYPL